jgi:hypothetical protein
MEFAQLSNRFFFYNAGVKTSDESARVTSISNERDCDNSS